MDFTALDFNEHISLFVLQSREGLHRMDLEAEILREHSKHQAVGIARCIGADRRRFKKLMELFLHGEYRVTQRSAWIVSQCYEQHPCLITPWLPAMLKKMQEPGVHDAVKRNGVRILQCIEIPDSLLGTVVSLCFDYLNSVDAPIAVKAHSMTVLKRIAEREPGLKRELRDSIELMLPYARPAIHARARMVLKRLEAYPVKT
ncbi:MAG: hypothetical protein V1709_04195 [Planctomycetota bacterium]